VTTLIRIVCAWLRARNSIADPGFLREISRSRSIRNVVSMITFRSNGIQRIWESSALHRADPALPGKAASSLLPADASRFPIPPRPCRGFPGIRPFAPPKRMIRRVCAWLFEAVRKHPAPVKWFLLPCMNHAWIMYKSQLLGAGSPLTDGVCAVDNIKLPKRNCRTARSVHSPSSVDIFMISLYAFMYENDN
jgi:hypothetical protein